MRREELKGHLDLILLAALEGEPAHGYGIIRAIDELTGGTFDLAEGTIYPALQRLETAGHLASAWETVGGRRRRVYRLTTPGQRELARRRQQWGQFALAMTRLVETP